MSDGTHGENGSDAKTFCPVETTIGLIGGKYKPLILWKLAAGKLRFSQLQKEVALATPKMLTQQLRELENAGLINRKVYPIVPPKVEYSLTDLGWSIHPVLEAMYHWGNGYLISKGHNANCTMTPPQQRSTSECNQAIGRTDCCCCDLKENPR